MNADLQKRYFLFIKEVNVIASGVYGNIFILDFIDSWTEEKTGVMKFEKIDNFNIHIELKKYVNKATV